MDLLISKGRAGNKIYICNLKGDLELLNLFILVVMKAGSHSFPALFIFIFFRFSSLSPSIVIFY